MKALVLAAGFPQIALIQELKSRNIEVLLADYNKEPVAKKYADKYFQVSTLDVPAIKKLAEDEKVDFLITACTDQALLTVAKVSDDLGLPCYIDYKTALNVTNKSYMKEVFNKNNISTAKHVILAEFDEAKISNFKYPIIVKPVDCNSSKGVVKVTNLEELIAAFEMDAKYSRTGTVIIEEFIQGPELTVDVYVENGKASVLSVSQSDKIKEEGKFVIYRTRYPALCSDELMEKIRNTAQQIADSFGLKNSPMLIQMISDGKDVYVLEFSARTGGGVKYLLIKQASGFDVIKCVVDLTLGIKPHCEVKKSISKYITNTFIYCKSGVFDHLDGFDELKAKQIISDYYLFKWKGAEFDSVASSGDRVAGYTVQSDDLDDLINKYNIARKELHVMDIEGNDMMCHDLIEDLSYQVIG